MMEVVAGELVLTRFLVCSILKTFLDSNSEKVTPLFLVHGKTANGEEKISIVRKEEEAKEGLDEVYYSHIYAVYPSL